MNRKNIFQYNKWRKNSNQIYDFNYEYPVNVEMI